MKKFISIILLLLVGFSKLSAQGGELYFLSTTPIGYTIDLTISTTEYSWLWDSSNLKPYPVLFSTFSKSNDNSIVFSAPKTTSSPPHIPWGKFSISMIVKDSNGQTKVSRNFTLDLGDENWSFTLPPYVGADTYIKYNGTNNTIEFIADNNNGFHNSQVINNGSVCNIWDIWQVGTPLQSNFKVPVVLQNRVEGETFDFGYLKTGTSNINSGSSAEFKDGIQNSVEHGTTETTYNNQRKYSFKWGNTFADPIANSNLYNTVYNFTVTNTQNNKSITRSFKTVWPLTIKNNLVENGGISTDSVYFKDPTTDNQFHSYSASGSGYAKNESFDALSITVGSQTEQKYSVKAKSEFPYSSRQYYWISGDFNPTTQSDIMVTAATTLTANYKGHLISNSNTGFNSNSQRKVVRTDDGKLHMVYESMNQVWYAYSTDGGANWQKEQKVDDASVNTKSCSISQNSNIVFIVYQSDFGTGMIRAARFENGIRSWVATVYTLSSYSYDTQPVIAAYGSDGGLIVFKPTSTSPLRARNVKCTSIYCTAGTVGTDFQISYSTSNSTSPSLVYNSQRMFLAFQDGSSQIKYVKLTAGDDYENALETSTVSTGSPFTNNQSPSISVQAENPVISWNGFNTPIPSAVIKRKTGTTWSNFNTFASGTVRYTNNNSRRDGGEGSIIAWCDIYNAHKFVKLDTDNYSSILTLPVGSGNGQIQVSNGIGFSDMKAVAYQQPTSGIYPVTFINYNFQTLQKVNSAGNMNYGRMAII